MSTSEQYKSLANAPSRSTISVGDEVIVTNNGNYDISEFGQQFINRKVEVMSIFKNPAQLDMAAVALPGGSCCCFLIKMLEPVRSHKAEALIAIQSAIREVDEPWLASELAGKILSALDDGDIPNYGYSPEE